jgi:hypothetical protein
MSKNQNPEFAKYASDLARAQDAMRSANEELIKLTQRFGGWCLSFKAIRQLFSPGLTSTIKSRTANKADDELLPSE